MKFLQCVTSSDPKRNSRKHRKGSRRRRRNSRSSYLSPSATTKRSHPHQTDYPSGIRIHNRNAFHQPINEHSTIDINPMNYIEMGVPTIFEHQVYPNNQNSSQKVHSNMNQLFKMNSKVYPSTSSGYQSVMNSHVPRGNVFYSGVDKKRRKKVSHLFESINYIHVDHLLFISMRYYAKPTNQFNSKRKN